MMKKKFFGLLLPMIFISGALFAQMDNLANLSAKWIRSNIRNASLDGGGDMVNFNPAGLAMLDDGMYISLSSQTIFRKPKHTFDLGAGEKSVKQDGIDPVLPMLYAAYKKNHWAVSTGAYISGGGGSANYPNGSVNTNFLGYMVLQMVNTQNGTDFNALADQSLNASSFYITIPLAFSYAVNDQISFSAGARYIRALNNTKAGLTLIGSSFAENYALDVNYKSKANGIGGVFGVDYKPMDKLNLSIHYETKVKLEFEASDNKGNFSIEEDGDKSRRDLPAVINTGITYSFTNQLTAGIDFNYYFQKAADWGTLTDPRTAHEKDASDAAGNCYTANAGLLYAVNPKFQISVGGSYTAFLYDDRELYYTKMGVYETNKNNNLNIGFGAGYKLSDKVEIDLGAGRTFWKESDIESLNAGGIIVTTNNKAWVLAAGIDLRL